MFASVGLPAEVLRLAAVQHGVVSRRQLLTAGVSRSCIGRRAPTWLVLLPGIYLIAPGFEAPTFRSRAWAGVLYAGEDARLWKLSAAVLHGLVAEHEHPADLDRSWTGTRPAAASTIQVLAARRQLRDRPGFEFTQERPGVRSGGTLTQLARTGIDDTVLDLCAAGPEDGVLTWVTRACQRRLTTPRRLLRRLAARTSLRHRATVLEILGDVDAGATTALEHRALRDVFRAHGLPPARWQLRIGRRIVDAGYPDYGVIVELDGQVGHVEEGVFRDRHRDNVHSLSGWVTLRFGWWEVSHDPCGVARQIAAALDMRGWRGTPRPCSRCP